jgi:SAM-dependent methyltransferase
MTQEADAVRKRYARRSHDTDARRYSMLSPAVFQSVHERQRQVLSLFRRLGFADVSSLRLVEVGAGSGAALLEFLRMGFAPENLVGIELLPERAAMARRLLPAGVQVVLGDASEQRIAAGSVDIVYQAGVFSSLLDDDFQASLARTMWEWVRPGGGILWYDFAFDNPANPDVRGISVRRVRQLFESGDLWWHRVTLAPPIARRVSVLHPALYGLFNAIPLLRTHRLCWIGKP